MRQGRVSDFVLDKFINEETKVLTKMIVRMESKIYAASKHFQE